MSALTPILIGITLVVVISYYLWIRATYRRETVAGGKAFAAGDWNAAEAHFRNALAAARRSSHPPADWVTTCFVNLTLNYSKAGRGADALRHVLLANVYMPEPSRGVPDRFHLVFEIAAEMLENAGQFGEAAKFRRAVVERLRISVGEKQADFALALDRLGLTLQSARLESEAAASFEQAISIYGAQTPAKLAEKAGVSFHRAKLKSITGSSGEAVSDYMEVITELAQAPGDNRFALGSAWSNLGALYNDLGRHSEALNAYDHALEFRRAQFGDGHVRCARILNNRAGCLGRKGDLEAAQARAIQSVDVFREHNDPALANGLDTLGTILMASGRYAEAESAFSEACNLVEASGKYQSDFHEYTQRRAEALEKMGRLGEAATCRARAVQVSKAVGQRLLRILAEGPVETEAEHSGGAATGVRGEAPRPALQSATFRALLAVALTISFWVLALILCASMCVVVWWASQRKAYRLAL